jgi:hypothetical protein
MKASVATAKAEGGVGRLPPPQATKKELSTKGAANTSFFLITFVMVFIDFIDLIN